MTLLSTTRSKIAAAAVLAAVTASVGTAVAFASQAGPARAPYAQAGALVEYNGALSQSKGIAPVQKPSAGTYCIKFTDARLDPQKLIPTAVLGASGTTPWDATIMVRTDPWAACGNATDTVTVFTGTSAGAQDLPFYIAIH
ncbi:hypothetical protein [Streptomyces sp. NBC_01244]|uniref:hypothetical protein n=1 Tax=Streptomyces sp. NBC_01244 TaxID=2903797 RepID=UPI002E110B2D|nr:hypothetical protein OG247_20505 [Streptomyces sp. NBC_01244]